MEDQDKNNLRESLKNESRERLIEVIIQQVKQIEGLRSEIESLKEKNEELERKQHRQAAPFRREESERKSNPKSQGREKGHKGSYRKEPESVDHTINVELSACPHCRGQLSNIRPIEQIIEELPPVRPIVYKLTTYKGECTQCGEVQSTHPLKTCDATGAAKVQLGPRAKATAIQLNYGYGLSKRSTEHIMRDIYGLSATVSGWQHAFHRVGERCEEDYEQLIEQAKHSAYIHSDETSWYMGAPKSWLWVFTNEAQTLYKVSTSRGREVIQEIIGNDYQGVLISDCLAVYDGVSEKQQKCYAHHLKEIHNSMKNHPEKGEGYLKEVEVLLKTAMHIKSTKHEVSYQRYQQACENLEAKADELLYPARSDPVEEYIANRLRKQRDHLFTFLYEEEVDATNNLAERQLRPAVIARKISCGNKTRKGADTWQRLSSLIETNRQQGHDNIDYFQQKATLSTREHR